MFLLNHLISNIIWPMLLFFLYYADGNDAAKCTGSVIFHWREGPQKSKTEQRNWGVLKRQIGGNKSKLSIFFDTNNTYAFTRNGDCCWDVYPKNGYRGDPVRLTPTLTSGFGGIPGYPQFKANSLKKVTC